MAAKTCDTQMRVLCLFICARMTTDRARFADAFFRVFVTRPIMPRGGTWRPTCGIIFVLFRWDSLIFFVPQIFIYTRSRVLLFAFCVLIGRYDPFRSMFNIANRETVLEHERRICFCRGAFPVISWLFINQRYARLFANDSSLYSQPHTPITLANMLHRNPLQGESCLQGVVHKLRRLCFRKWSRHVPCEFSYKQKYKTRCYS